MKRLAILLFLVFILTGCAPQDSIGLGDMYTNNIFPGVTNTYTLGNPSYVWATGYLQTVYLPSLPSAPASVAGYIGLHAMDSHNITGLQAINGGGFMYELSQDTYFVGRNTTGSQINKGQAVYVNGATGNVPNVALAKADNSTTVRGVGVAAENIAVNGFGRFYITGVIENINTNAFAVGDSLYISPTVAGNFTATRPAIPNYVKEIGVVVVKGVGNGAILIRVSATLNDVMDAYGQLYNDEAASTTTVVSAGTYYLITGWTAGLSYLTTLSVASSNITIDAGGQGKYLITFNAGILNSGANRVTHIGVFLNGNEQTNLDMETKTGAIGDTVSLGTTGILSLVPGDVITLRVTSATNGDVVTFNHASLTINRIAR